MSDTTTSSDQIIPPGNGLHRSPGFVYKATDLKANGTDPLAKPQARVLVYDGEIPSEDNIQKGRVPRTTGAPL